MNVCIEFDGEQHFRHINYFGDIDAFNRLKYRDKLKTEYCISKNIPLLRLSYLDLKKGLVEKKLTEFLKSQTLITKFENFKNLHP